MENKEKVELFKKLVSEIDIKKYNQEEYVEIYRRLYGTSSYKRHLRRF